MEKLVPTMLNQEFMWNFSTTGEHANAPNTGFGMDCTRSPIEPQHDMEAALLDIMKAQWYNGSVFDATQAYSTPLFMLIQAVDQMAQAKQLGKEEKKEEQEEEQ